jgi:hypothetical protein
MSKKRKSKIEISFEVAAFLAYAVEDMIESAEDHLEWLEANPDEPDHDQQRASTEHRLELARRALARLAAA